AQNIPQQQQTLSLDTLKALLDSLDAGAALVTFDGVIVYANSHFVEMIDGHHKNPVGRHLQDCISASSWPALQEAISHVPERPVHGEIRVKSHEHEDVIRLAFASMSPAGLIGITATRVTELAETTRLLETSQASVESLSARILRVQDE